MRWPARSTESDLAPVDVADEACLEPGRRSGREPAIAGRWLDIVGDGGGSEPRRGRRHVSGPQAQLVGDGRRPERGARHQGHGDRRGQADAESPPATDACDDAARQAEAAVEARAQERQQPWIAGLQRRHEGLRPAQLDLGQQAADRRQKEQQAADPERDEERMGPSAARHGRPDGRQRGDGEWQQERGADHEVERAAGAIADEDEYGGQAPRGDEGDPDQAEAESADTHAASLATPIHDGVRPRRKYRHGRGPMGHRDRSSPGPACPYRTGLTGTGRDPR